MKTMKGFMLAENPNKEERKTLPMIPFLPYVATDGLIITDQVDINKQLTKLSGRWKNVSSYDAVDYSAYTLSCSYKNASLLKDNEDIEKDENGDPIPFCFSGQITYTFYKNGVLRVDGFMRTHGLIKEFTPERELVDLKVLLPFACPSDGDLTANYAFGTVNGLTVIPTLEYTKINNPSLNKDGTDKKDYIGILRVQVIYPKNSDVSEIAFAREIADEDMAKYNYKDYISKHLPIRFSIENLVWADFD